MITFFKVFLLKGIRPAMALSIDRPFNIHLEAPLERELCIGSPHRDHLNEITFLAAICRHRCLLRRLIDTLRILARL